MTFAILFYDVVLWLHILAVVVAFGVTFTYPLFYAVAAGSAWPQRAALHAVLQRVSRNYISFGLLAVVLAGAYLATDGHVWDEPWVGAPLLIAIAIGAIGGAYIGPRERRLVELSRAESEPEYLKVLGQVRIGAYAVSGLVVVAIFLMTTKPG